MDLKIKDVSDLLNVSETTIRRWLVDGKIPAYRLNHQYRFSRIEIEKWIMSRKLKQPDGELVSSLETQIYPTCSSAQSQNQRTGIQQFNLYRAIHRGGVFANIAGNTKEEIIKETMRNTAQRLGLDAEVLTDLLLDREKLMPTALNNGIGVPHTRDFLIEGPFDVIVVVFPQKPIAYGSLDGKPVHTLFFLFSSADKRHLHLLAKLAHLSSHGPSLEMLRTKPDEKKFLDYIRDWESNMHPSSDP